MYNYELLYEQIRIYGKTYISLRKYITFIFIMHYRKSDQFVTRQKKVLLEIFSKMTLIEVERLIKDRLIGQIDLFNTSASINIIC